jgi:hypothetical protein
MNTRPTSLDMACDPCMNSSVQRWKPSQRTCSRSRSLSDDKDVELLYVVDGYQVTLLEETTSGTSGRKFFGETLRDAIDAAMSATEGENCEP